MRNTQILLGIALAALCTSCQTSQQQLLKTDKSQVELRQMQSRAFDTTDNEKALRNVIATLQDLGFVINKADATLGTVTATKLQGYNLVMTVSTRQKGNTQLIVRASAQYNIQAVTEPKLYQDFFTALSKAMFLDAHQVD
jgi:hypothetical protein